MRLTLTAILLFLTLYSSAQSEIFLPNQENTSSNQSHYTNKQRYKIDFEIKNLSNPSDDILSSIDFKSAEKFRNENTRTEVTDANTGLTIILYSVVEALQKESESKIVIDYIRKLYFREQ